MQRPDSILTGRDTLNDRSMGPMIEASMSIGQETQGTAQSEGARV